MTDSALVGEAMSRDVLTVGPGHTLREVAQVLARQRVGSAVVHDTDGAGIGIITERDILRLCSRDPHSLGMITVDAIMTRNLIVGRLEDDIEQIMAVMTRMHIRHLPVLDGDTISGMISIGDLVKSQLDEREVIITYLRDYITGTRI